MILRHFCSAFHTHQTQNWEPHDSVTLVYRMALPLQSKWDIATIFFNSTDFKNMHNFHPGLKIEPLRKSPCRKKNQKSLSWHRSHPYKWEQYHFPMRSSLHFNFEGTGSLTSSIFFIELRVTCSAFKYRNQGKLIFLRIERFTFDTIVSDFTV